MNIKGSSKRTWSFALVILLTLGFVKNEIMDAFGIMYVFYAIILSLFVFAIEMFFDKNETISCDIEKIFFDLKRYKAEFNINEIQNISLAVNSNDLTIETKSSKEYYKLYGFRRKKILEFIEYINIRKTI